MRFFVILLLILFNLLIVEAKADCPACWELRKVEITFKNGSMKKGFVYWNDQWTEAKWQNKFPESFVAYHKNKLDTFRIHLIQKLYTIKNDSLPGFIATTKADIFKFRISDLKHIVEIDKDSPRNAAAGLVAVYSLQEMEILKTNPFATFYVNESVLDAYLVSYNKEINREALRKLFAKRQYHEMEWKKINVLLVLFEFD